MDIGRIIKKAARDAGAELVGFTKFDGEHVVIMIYSEENADNLREIDEKAERISKGIHQAGFDARIIGSMDGEGISLRSLAEEAGLGFIGRNGLLITEDFGPEVRLSGILTNVKLPIKKELKKKNECENCLKCQMACPSEAIEQKSVEKCRSIVENSGKSRCTICIEVCPHSRPIG